MPRKKNGVGSFGSSSFKKLGGVNRGKTYAPGSYNRYNQYGSSVTRTVIEQYDLNSDWTKWRRGYEFYNKAAWYRLQDYDPFTREYTDAVINSKLYQGTEYEVDVQFDGYRFATKDADSNNHYVIKRTTVSDPDLGALTTIYNSNVVYPDQKAYREIWAQGTPGTEARLLLRMIGERLTDGETEATLNYVMTEDKVPSLYIGKGSTEHPAEVRVTVNKDLILNSDYVIENGLQSLVGKIVYYPEFFIEKPTATLSNPPVVKDEAYSWTVTVDDSTSGQLTILDPGQSELPPTMYDISSLPAIVKDIASTATLKGDFIFNKNIYQRFYGQTYLTGDTVVNQSDFTSYSVMPFAILAIDVVGSDIEIVSVPIVTEMTMTIPVGAQAYLVFADWSFTKTRLSNNGWRELDTDVDPWMDEVFASGQPLKPATVYACSCPNHAHAILRAPQSTESDEARKINRQRRYPLPTVLGRNSFDNLGMSQVAGLAESWETREHKMSFKMCKHSIAAMFIEHLRVKEPNKYPSYESRLAFEEKLEKEIEEVGEEFVASYKRGGITSLEIVFALSQVLNLDEVETASVMFNSKF